MTCFQFGNFFQQSDGEIGEEELYFDIYENNLGGKVNVSLKYYLRKLSQVRGIFSKDSHEHKKTQQAINV